MRSHLFAVLLALTAVWPVFAQAPALPTAPVLTSVGGTPPIEPPVAVPDDVRQQRQVIAERLRVARAQLDEAKQDGEQPPASTDNLSRHVGNLKQLDVILTQQQSADERKGAIEKQIAELDTQLKALRAGGPSEPKPYSFLLLDRLRDELVGEAGRREAVDATVAATSEALERAKAVLQEKERARRQAKEAADTNKDEAAAPAPALATALADAELASRLAAEAVKLQETELAAEKLAQQFYELRLTFLKEKVEAIGKDTNFTYTDLQEQIVELEKQEDDLKRSLQSAESTAPFLDRQWFEASERLDAAAEPPPVLVEEVEARRLARLAQQQRITIFSQRLARLEENRKVWERRYKIAEAQATDEERETWYKDALLNLDQLDRERRLQLLRIDDVRKDQSTLDSKVDQGEPQWTMEVTRWLHDQQRQFDELLKLYERNLLSIDASRRLHEKLVSETREAGLGVSLGDRLGNLWDSCISVWNYELAAIDDRPITVKKIVTGVLLLFVGYLLSRLLARLFGTRFLPRVGVNPSAAAALQSVMFYALIVLFCVFSLRVVNIPLTAFTLLGGALALGVGFGSQNIINNFMSGLILLAERPIKVGDLVEIDSLYGNVEHIGARSTRIRTGSNHEIIVPNSSFLETNVVNWTLSDDRIRTVVKVGVIYGSSTRDVTRLLMKAVSDHGKVLPKPEPIILFSDFADNSLNFEIHFWIKMRTIMERLRTESDIRFMIDQLFREAGLVIAFPQRDVHLDTAAPLEVRLVTDSDKLTDSATPDQTGAA